MESGKTLHVPVAGETAVLHFTRTGAGDRVMLTFHGFGQSGRDMAPVAAAVGDTHTTYHLDIFFHGGSQWPQALELLTKERWHQVLLKFLEAEGIGRFSIGAFSMGGKFALATVEGFPGRIDELILIAPDGIRISPWYRVATGPAVLRNYFRSFIPRPGRLFGLTRRARRLGMIDRGVARFVTNEMDTPQKREKVYNSWIVFRKLRFSMAVIGGLIRAHGIGLTIITGKYDKVIQTRHMQRLLRYVPEARVLEIESGHNHLVSKGMRKFQHKNE